MISDDDRSVLGTILIVDDEPLIAMLVEDALQEERFSCILAASGSEAIGLLEADGAQIDALMTDIRMPGEITGWFVAHRARELFPDIPVIYFTGDSMADLDANTVAGGKLLGKPIPVEDIVSTLKGLLPVNRNT